ncbi:hypothetical protein ACHAXT_010100 [Thalassiosira profunda]
MVDVTTMADATIETIAAASSTARIGGKWKGAGGRRPLREAPGRHDRWQGPPPGHRPDFPRPPPHPGQRQSFAPAPPPYKAGDVVSGAITRIEPYGVFVALDPPSDYVGAPLRRTFTGLAHVSALRPPEEGRVEHPSDVFKMDDRVDALVLEIIPPEEDGSGRPGRHKIRLSLAAIDP